MKNKITKVISMILTICLSFSIMITGPVNANTLQEKDLEIVWLKEELEPASNTFRDGLLSVKRTDRQYGFINKEGEVVIPLIYNNINFDFSEGLAGVELNGKRICINKEGKEVFSSDYWFKEFSEGLAAVKKDGKVGYINKKGELVIPFISGLDEEGFEKSDSDNFSEGLALVDKSYSYKGLYGGFGHFNEVGYINKEGKEVIPFIYLRDGRLRFWRGGGDFSEGLAWVIIGNRCGYINKEGKEVIPFKYDEAGDFSEGLAWLSNGSGRGYINKEGKEVIPFIYGHTANFSEGLAVVARISDYGYINKKGEEVTPMIYEVAGNFSEGLACVNRDKTYGKYGYINQKGEEIIPRIFYWANDFNEGVALVKKDGRYGILKNPLKKGTTAAPAAPVAAQGITATYSQLPITLNGNVVDNMEVYSIDGNTYFKLRDIAMLAQATTKKFSVDWNSEKKLISLQTGKDYVANGSELKAGDKQNKNAQKSAAKIEVNGKEISPTAYTINGNNYFKLRELGEALNFEVKWNEEAKRIEVEMK